MTPHHAQHPVEREIIHLDSDDSGGDGLSTRPQSPSHELPNLNRHISTPVPRSMDPEAYQECLKAILAVFPDISHDHVQQLWNKLAWGALIGRDALNHTLIERILDGGAYPKERDRLRELKKRKRASPEAEAAKWRYADLRHDPEEYARVAKARLLERFDWVPSRFIHDTFRQHAHYYGAFFAIVEADRKRGGSIDAPFQNLKAKRSVSSKPEQVMASLEAEGHDFEGLKEEMRNADARWQKEETNRKAEKERCEAKAASDEEYRRKGETMECACCFSDDNPPTSMTHCDADTPHFFCFVCAKQNADSDIASLKYELRCMDQSRCQASFARLERARFLDAATIDKLERLQQQDEIRRAELGDLASCPFCEYAAICPPAEVDRIFECQNPDCLEASCRLCKQKSHVPLSCDEFKRESGIGERHAVEEARTEALIRSCKKCQVRILKEDGCNKVVCTNCYSTICDYCGEDISKSKYEHFDGEHQGLPTGKGKCPLYDASNRKEDQIEKAGKAAMDKVRKENPSLSEEDLKIKFAKVVQDQSRRHSEMPNMRLPPGAPMPIWRQRMQAGRPGPLPADPFGPYMQIPHQQQLQDLYMLQAQADRRIQGELQRIEAERRRLLMEVGEGGPHHRPRHQDERALGANGRAIGFQPYQPAFGHPPDGTGIQPRPGPLPIIGPPLAGLPLGNGPALEGPGAAGWQRYNPALRIGQPHDLYNADYPRNDDTLPSEGAEQGQARHEPRRRNFATQEVELLPPRPHPAHQPVLRRAQALNDIDAEFRVPNSPRPHARAAVGPNFHAGALAQPLQYNPPGTGPPLLMGDPLNGPINLGIPAGMGLGHRAPGQLIAEDFEAFMTGWGVGENGRQTGRGFL